MIDSKILRRRRHRHRKKLFFPWVDVNNSIEHQDELLADEFLDRDYPPFIREKYPVICNEGHLNADEVIDILKERYLPEARRCPCCETDPDKLSWVYFRSPGWTWEMLCGRAGILTICNECRVQVDFFMISMS